MVNVLSLNDGTGKRRDEDVTVCFRLYDSTAAVQVIGRLFEKFRSNCILVDPASCHMLVSKIKPCMSKYTLWHSETANGSLNQLWFIGSCLPMWITVVILELIHATGPDFTKGRFY